MATAGEPTEKKPIPPPETSMPPASNYVHSTILSKKLEDAAPWIDSAVQQTLLYQKTVQETVDSAIEASRSRLSQILSTSSAHLSLTIDALRDLKSDYVAYEDLLFGKVKEGVNVATSHPLITSGVALGLGVLALKGPRRFLYYNTVRMFVSEEALLSTADLKVKELRHSVHRLVAETEKLERIASIAEGELIRGRTKLRQAGKQIQGAIKSAYKIEEQAAGLKDVLGELPRREASRFRSQVSNLASEAKKERNALTKEVTKISNYGISV